MLAIFFAQLLGRVCQADFARAVAIAARVAETTEVSDAQNCGSRVWGREHFEGVNLPRLHSYKSESSTHNVPKQDFQEENGCGSKKH